MIRFLFRWAFRFLVLGIVLVVALILLKDTLARNYAEAQITRKTGFQAKIGKLEFNLTAPMVTMENFVLYNPPEFGGSAFLDIPEVHAEYDRGELARDRVHLKLLRLNIRELNVVLDQQGRTNLIEFAHNAEVGRSSAKRRGKGANFGGADMLNLSLGKVRYTDLRFPARDQEINLDLRNELIPNVRSEEDLAAILFRVLLRAGVTIYLDGKGAARREI